MLEGKAYVKDTDMPLKMQVHAMDSASQALDLYDVVECTTIAAYIKKEFDSVYGGGWQCVVGTNFSSFFTHSKGSFIYFSLETLNFLIFKVCQVRIQLPLVFGFKTYALRIVAELERKSVAVGHSKSKSVGVGISF
ncbi:putative dynein ATPase [Helianthus annuus]|uniref:Dynein light chain n=1 Tax=Helianthus annuus TaxID=4232 RepID=A0A251TPZ8_HELAN|nr:putative dynein ATPase [Helianthus annuus]